jgi:hypothetical protein
MSVRRAKVKMQRKFMTKCCQWKDVQYCSDQYQRNSKVPEDNALGKEMMFNWAWFFSDKRSSLPFGLFHRSVLFLPTINNVTELTKTLGYLPPWRSFCMTSFRNRVVLYP